MSATDKAMTADRNVYDLAEQLGRKVPFTAIIGWQHALVGIRDNPTVRGIFREWLRRIESPDAAESVIQLSLTGDEMKALAMATKQQTYLCGPRLEKCPVFTDLHAKVEAAVSLAVPVSVGTV